MIFRFLLQIHSVFCTLSLTINNPTGNIELFNVKNECIHRFKPCQKLKLRYSSSAETNFLKNSSETKLTITNFDGEVEFREINGVFSSIAKPFISNASLSFQFAENTSININTGFLEKNLEYAFDVKECENVESITNGDTLLSITSISKLNYIVVECIEENGIVIEKKENCFFIKISGTYFVVDWIENEENKMKILNNDICLKFKENSTVTFGFKKLLND